jgi:hypothetical protein
MKITDLNPAEFLVEDSISTIELARCEARNELRLLLRRRVRQLETTADAHEQLPIWLQFARARQGIE